MRRFCVDDHLAHRLLLDRLDHLGDVAFLIGELLQQRSPRPRSSASDTALWRSCLATNVHRLRGCAAGRAPRPSSRRAGSSSATDDRALRLADRRAQLVLHGDERLHRGERGVERVEHHVLGQHRGAALDHHDAVARAGDDQREVALVDARCIGGLTTKRPSMRPTRTAAIGPRNGMSEMCSAADAPISASMSASFSLSDDSTVAMICVSHAEALREERADRAIDQARGQHLLLGLAPFALEEAAGDLAGGEGLLLVVAGQREEIDARRARSGWRRR